MRKHRKCYSDISAWADIGAKLWLHDIRPLVSPMTSLQLFVFPFEDWIQHVHVCKMATGKSRFHWSCYLNISTNLVSVWEIHFFFLIQCWNMWYIDQCMPFSISKLLLSLNRYRWLISITLVSVWEVNFVLFNSMLKYVINRLMHAFFHSRNVIIPRPISTLGLKPSDRYRSLGMITVLIG